MVSGLQRRIALRRKLHILRTLTCSKSVKRRSIIADPILYIYMVKLKLEKIKRELEYFNLMSKIKLPKREVKVEKAGKGFVVRVICEKGGQNLVPILEVFEELGLMVLNARVSCNFYFAMEATVVPEEEEEEEEAVNVKNNIAQAVLQAIERQANMDTETSNISPVN